jgi:hypothetical protein
MRLYGVLTRLPDRILQILLSIFVAAYLAAETGLYLPYVVAPLAIIFILVTWRFVPTDVVPTRGHAIATATAIVLALVWVVLQLPFETEFVVASRDPGIYSNMGAALALTGHSNFDVASAIADSAGIPNTSANLGSFVTSGTSVRLQGGNALPSLLGIGYWLGGVDGLTVVNSVVGGVALLALFSLGRRILGAFWGLFPALILGVSMPMVYFSRAPYTEVISLAIFLGAAIWFWGALSTGRQRDFVMAGIFAGAASLTRIDALLGVAALLGTFIVILVGFARPRQDYDLRRSFVSYVVPVVVLTAFGAYDLLHNFRRYVSDLGSQPIALWALLIVVLIAGFVVLAIRSLVASRASRKGAAVVAGGVGRPISDKPARVVALILCGVVMLFFVFLALRPNFIEYHFNTVPNTQVFVEGLEASSGLPLDGSRSFDEYSLYWFVWYFGAPFVIAAALGLTAALYRSVVSRRPGLLAFSVLTLGVALLYLNKIAIAPDQMWAFRRVLPIVAPGFIVAAVYVVKWLAARRHVVGVWVAGGLITLLVVGTVGAWSPRLFITTEYSNQAREVTTICTTLGQAKTVILVDRGPNPYALTLKAFCNVNVVSVYTNTPAQPTSAQQAADLASTQKTLAALEQRVGAGTPVVLFDSTLVRWQGETPGDLQSTIIDTWQRTLLSQPHGYDVSTRTTWMGRLQQGGLVKGEQ